MSFTDDFINEHIGKRGEVKNPYFEEDARVTKHSRIHNAATGNIEFLENEIMEGSL